MSVVARIASPPELGMIVFRKTVRVLDVRLRAKRYGETSP
jgi:hypothetical protein